MASELSEFKVKVSDKESVTAILYPAGTAKRARITLLLGHGAGADQFSGFMRMVASGFAERGLDAMTFNFLYKEQGRSVPDPNPRLESCYRGVIDAAMKHRRLKKNRLIIGGKSMGGRIASQVAMANSDGIDGLVFLGYPLHPPGRPDRLRDAHLPKIKAPMLFVQGSRDAFGSEDEIRAIISKHRLKAMLHVIAGGDHSFKVPKSVAPQQKVYEDMMDYVTGWISRSIA